MMTIKEYVEKIETVVSKQFDLDIDVIKSKSRVQELVDARDVLVYLLSKYLDFSITKISKYLGRTQASIMYSLKKTTEGMKNSKYLLTQVKMYEKSLKEELNL